MKYSMFVGRWQGLPEGDRWLFDQQLKKGKNILICIRDCPLDDPDEENEFIAEEIMGHLSEEYRDEILEGKVKVMIIPDVESINYGREVGYEIIEHKPPEEIRNIHGRELRRNEN